MTVANLERLLKHYETIGKAKEAAEIKLRLEQKKRRQDGKKPKG